MLLRDSCCVTGGGGGEGGAALAGVKWGVAMTTPFSRCQ